MKLINEKNIWWYYDEGREQYIVLDDISFKNRFLEQLIYIYICFGVWTKLRWGIIQNIVDKVYNISARIIILDHNQRDNDSEHR